MVRTSALEDAFGMNHGEAAVEQDGDAAEEHAEVDTRFMQETQQAIVAEVLLWFETAEVMPEQDGDFGGDDGGENDDEQKKSCVAGIEAEHQRCAGEKHEAHDDADEKHGQVFTHRDDPDCSVWDAEPRVRIGTRKEA